MVGVKETRENEVRWWAKMGTREQARGRGGSERREEGRTKRDRVHCDGTREREVRVHGKRARNRLGEGGGPQSIDPPWRRR